MVNYTLGDLIHDSFRVTHGMIAVFPETGHEVTLSVDFFIAKFRKYKFKCVKSKEILIMHTFLCAGKKET